MHWQERLNCGPGRIHLGQGVVELLHWTQEQHLLDNQPHRHTHFEVCQVGAHGGGKYIVEGREFPIGPGDVFVARPGIVHQIVNTQTPGMELRWFCFLWLPATPPQASEVDILLNAFAASSVVAMHDDDGRVGALWDVLHLCASGPAALAYEAQTASLISALIVSVAQCATHLQAPSGVDAPRPEEGAVARQVLRYVHDNLERPMTVCEIATHLHVSPRHLTRLFQRSAGMPPLAYITRARLDRASALLLHSAMPIKEVASAVGYSDVHHFTRQFSRQFCTSPGQWRRHGYGANHAFP